MERTPKIFLFISCTAALVNFKIYDIFFAMIKILKDERGFLMVNVIFLTLITAFAAMILLNAASRVKNPQSTLRLTAIYLANEQLAQLESLAAKGSELPTSFQGEPKDLTTENLSEENPIEFEVKTEITGGDVCNVKVTVSWIANGREDSVEVERAIYVAEKNS